MNAFVYKLAIVFLLLAGRCTAQQLLIVKPDGQVFQSIIVAQYVVVELPDRFNRSTRYAGQVTQIGSESFTMKIRNQPQVIPLKEIKALRRISKFGAWARRSGRIIVTSSIAVAGNIAGDLTKGGSGLNQIVVPAGAAIGGGVVAYLLLHTPSLKKAKNGYSFTVGH